MAWKRARESGRYGDYPSFTKEKGSMAKNKSGGKRKGGKRKMSPAEKKKFLDRMKRGRNKAKRAAAAKPRKSKSAGRSKPRKAKKATAARSKPRKAKKATARHAAPKKTKKRHNKKKHAAPSKARARARSKKQLSTRGTVVIGGKPQPINMRVNVGERGHHRPKARSRKRGGHRRYHSNPMTTRVTSVYENPMTATEFAIGAGLAAVGMVGARALDRYLATRPYIAAMNATAGTGTLALDPSSAVNSAPGIMRIGAQLVLAAVPLVGSAWAGPKLRAGLQGFSIGVGANLFTSLIEHYVLVKFLAPKDSSGNMTAFVPGSSTPPTLMQRLYNDEISADMGRAATVAAGGSVAGLPARHGVGARRIPQGRAVDPGPRATARAGVGDCGDGSSSQPGCVVDPTCGTPGAVTGAGDIVTQAQQQVSVEGQSSQNTTVAPPANGTMSGLGAFPWMADGARDAAE